MNEIEQKLEQFKNSITYRNSLQKTYLTVMRKILESELMPEETLILLAKRIKPLVRIDKYLHPRSFGPSKSTFLVWTIPEDIKKSFLFNFSEQSIVKDKDGNFLPVERLEKVAEFPCYHRYGGYYGFLRPGVDEVIQQMPDYLWKNNQNEYAFELVFPSTDFQEIFDRALDRNVSSVVVYRVNGFPERIKRQKVLYKGKSF